MSSRELTEWAAYYSLEPWGEERSDYRTGVLASLVANLFRKKNSKALTPEDFMPKFGGQDGPNWEGMLAKVKQLNAVFRGTDKTGSSLVDQFGKPAGGP